MVKHTDDENKEIHQLKILPCCPTKFSVHRLKEMYGTQLRELVFRAKDWKGQSHRCVHVTTIGWNNLCSYVVVFTKNNPCSFSACVDVCSGQEKLQVALSALEIPWSQVMVKVVVFCELSAMFRFSTAKFVHFCTVAFGLINASSSNVCCEIDQT